MYADLGLRVVVADLDPQANLTAAFLDEDRLEQLWPEGDHPDTISGCIQPLRRGTGDIADPHLEDVVSSPQLSLFNGPIALLAIFKIWHMKLLNRRIYYFHRCFDVFQL
jgi:cellulose biosynthesis protein BcsQ